MARRAKQPEEQKLKACFKNQPPEFRPVNGARRLVTVDDGRAPIPASLVGCIVRVRPRAGEEDESEFAHWLSGVREVAARVILMPAPASKVVPDAVREAAPQAEDARRVVMAMVEEANVEDRDALRSLVERTLTENGL